MNNTTTITTIITTTTGRIDIAVAGADMGRRMAGFV